MHFILASLAIGSVDTMTPLLSNLSSVPTSCEIVRVEITSSLLTLNLTELCYSNYPNAQIDDSASPRNPNVETDSRSLKVDSLDVWYLSAVIIMAM